MSELEIAIASSLSDLTGRVGHGVGLDITELPQVAEDDLTVLERGMVITIEPGVATGYGIFDVEEQILVTDGDPEGLSQAPRHLIEVVP